MAITNPLAQLITEDEVLGVIPQKRTTDPGNFQNSIRIKEEGLFRAWLGYSFYEALIADLNVPAAVVDFQEGTTYSSGDVVRYHEKLFTALQNTTGVELPNSKQATTYWKHTEKFSTAAYNFLWERYLKLVLAWHIFHTTVIYSAIQANNLGVGSHTSPGHRSAGTKELSLFKQEIGADLNAFLLTMDAYLRENSGDFGAYAPNADSTKVKPGRRRKYHGFTGFGEEYVRGI